MSDPIEVGSEELRTLCKLGSGTRTCRYLICRGGLYLCAKSGCNIRVLMANMAEPLAQGDNCSGPPDFKPLYPKEEELLFTPEGRQFIAKLLKEEDTVATPVVNGFIMDSTRDYSSDEATLKLLIGKKSTKAIKIFVGQTQEPAESV